MQIKHNPFNNTAKFLSLNSCVISWLELIYLNIKLQLGRVNRLQFLFALSLSNKNIVQKL